MPRFSLSALGVDAPGIVSAVSGALGDQGCNLDDSTMTILRGHFAILLVVTAPDGTDATALESAVKAATEDFDLVVGVRPMTDAPQTSGGPGDADALTISLHGADRPGIVHAIAESLASSGGNVVDLSTQLVDDPGSPVYVMTLRAVGPPGSGDAIAGALRETAEQLGVSCSIREDGADVL